MKGLAAWLLVSFVSSCATVGYQQKDPSGYGYQETQLHEDIFRVDYLGQEGTDPATLKDYTLLRCAELTLQKGFKYFSILETQSDAKVSVVTMPVAYHDPFDYYYRYPYPHPFRHRYEEQVITYVEPSLSNTIQCFRESPGPEFHMLIYDAEKIVINIKEKHKIP